MMYLEKLMLVVGYANALEKFYPTQTSGLPQISIKKPIRAAKHHRGIPVFAGGQISGVFRKVARYSASSRFLTLTG